MAAMRGMGTGMGDGMDIGRKPVRLFGHPLLLFDEFSSYKRA